MIAVPCRRSSSGSRAAVRAGLATGLRSQLAVAAIVISRRPSELPSILRHPKTRPVFAALALSELVVDKLPSTPNRTEPAGLITRAALGTVAGGLLASGPRHARLTSAIVGGATAVAAAFGGMAARSALTRRMPRLSAAAVEDAAAIVLAAAAIRVAARA